MQATVASQQTAAERTAWLAQAKWGVFFHFLPVITTPDKRKRYLLRDPEAPDAPARWNDLVDGFDTAGLAQQLDELGAGYFFLTAGQNSGYYCAPNAEYERRVPRDHSRLSQRDLIADCADALSPYDIRMMAYSTSLAPEGDKLACAKLQCQPSFRSESFKPSEHEPQDKDRLADFQRHWEAIHACWSKQWGSKVHGWWIDGCTKAEFMYDHADVPNFGSFARALRAGNPDSIVAFNPGVLGGVYAATGFPTTRKRPTRMTPHEDYLAGEVAGALPISGWDEDWSFGLRRRDMGDARYHILSFLGEWWAYGEPRLPDSLVLGYSEFVIANDGAITWDIPMTDRGLIPDAYMRQLGQLKNL